MRVVVRKKLKETCFEKLYFYYLMAAGNVRSLLQLFYECHFLQVIDRL